VLSVIVHVSPPTVEVVATAVVREEITSLIEFSTDVSLSVLDVSFPEAAVVVLAVVAIEGTDT
jgi:hypothetical protein